MCVRSINDREHRNENKHLIGSREFFSTAEGFRNLCPTRQAPLERAKPKNGHAHSNSEHFCVL